MKGMTAVEFLFTYGWAILIILVVIAALYAMGGFCIVGMNCRNITTTTIPTGLTENDCYNGCFLLGYLNSSIKSSTECKCCQEIPVRNMGNITYCEYLQKIGELEWLRE